MSDYTEAVIIWLDQYIGFANYCQTLKTAFYGTSDPEWSRSTRLNDININNFIKSGFNENEYSYKTNAIEIHAFSKENEYPHKTNAIEIHAFSKEEDCALCIQENKDKRIFFIVSNSLGEHFVPKMIENYPEVFQKADHNRPGSVYVFCRFVSLSKRWAIDYMEYVQIFDHETDLLAQLTRDMEDYFVNLGQEQSVYETPAYVRQPSKYFFGAETLFTRANEIEKRATYNQRERNVDRQIAVTKALLQQSTNDDDDDDDDVVIQYVTHRDVVDGSETDMQKPCRTDELNSSSSSFQSYVTSTQNSSFVTESDDTILTDDIEGKVLASTEKLAGKRQDSSDIRVRLLLPSSITKDFEQLGSILKELLGEKLFMVLSEQNYSKLLESKNLLVIIQAPSTDDDKLKLEDICSSDSCPSIYLFGHQPRTANGKKAFFTKYFQVCAMLDDPRELAVKVVLDVALTSRMIGDRYAQNKEKNRANKMYDQCVGLLNRLEALATKSMGNKDCHDEN